LLVSYFAVSGSAARRKVALVLLCLWLSLPDAASAEQRLFNADTFTLANGLEVVVITDRRVPVVSHTVWYRVGAADEPPGRSGLAHLLEHLMFKGTREVPAGEFSRLVARNGGQENAFTSYDYTAYFQNIASSRLELMMRLEADRMTGLVLEKADVASERQVVLEERRSRVDNDPGALLAEETQAARFRNHPYQRPIIGWAHEIEALTDADALAFYRQWYTPANAVLVVAGDIDAAELRPMVERTYGRIPGREPPHRQVLQEPEPHAERSVRLDDPRVRQPTWGRSWPAPSYGTGEQRHVYALQVLEEVLDGSTGRLYRSLVLEQKIAVSAGAHYDPTRRGPSHFSVQASPREASGVEPLAAAVQQQIDDIRNNGISDDEVERAKQRLQAEAVFARDSFSTAARFLGEARAIGQPLAEAELWPERIAAVSTADVAAAARAVFSEPAVSWQLQPAAGGRDPNAAAAVSLPSVEPTPIR